MDQTKPACRLRFESTAATAAPDCKLERVLGAADPCCRIDYWSRHRRNGHVVVDFMVSGLPVSAFDEELGQVLFAQRAVPDGEEVLHRVVLVDLGGCWTVVEFYANRPSGCSSLGPLALAGRIGCAHLFADEDRARTFGEPLAARCTRSSVCRPRVAVREDAHC